MDGLPQRKKLPHDIPSWVSDGATYFITICAWPRGANQLCHPEVATWIQESMEFRQARGEWWIHLVLLMPDHLHASMSFQRQKEMNTSIAQWKRYAAREAKIQWQSGYFEHRLRNDANGVEKAHYIRMNPVRAGLVEIPQAWPYVWPKDKAGLG
jgi:REP element-mobilizing transposase RayT